MEIRIRTAELNDFSHILELFREFATFEKQPEKMVNSLEKMQLEKKHFNCFVAETSDKEIIDYARETGCHKIRWQVSGWNTHAIEFYKNLGASIEGTEQNCDLILE